MLCIFVQLTKHGDVTLGGHRLRVGTSRFLSQGAFLVYKALLFVYFLFWGIYWPEHDGPNVERYLSFWTWCIATACEWLFFLDVRGPTLLREANTSPTGFNEHERREISKMKLR